MDEKSEQLRLERTLVATIRSGSPAAWGQLYDLYAPLLYRRILMPRLADPTSAEDALSETFRTAIEKFAQYEETEAGVYPWLARIAHNKAMDMHRVRSMTGRKIVDLTRLLEPLTLTAAGADSLLELRVEGAAMSRMLAQSMQSLNPRYRQTLTLRFLQELPRERCAEELSVKVGTFDVLLLRALRALKKAWETHPEQERHD